MDHEPECKLECFLFLRGALTPLCVVSAKKADSAVQTFSGRLELERLDRVDGANRGVGILVALLVRRWLAESDLLEGRETT